MHTTFGSATNAGQRCGLTSSCRALATIVLALAAIAAEAAAIELSDASVEQINAAFIVELARPDIAGAVVTHGTTALEETDRPVTPVANDIQVCAAPSLTLPRRPGEG